MQDLHKSKLTLTTGNKILTAKDLGQGLISVNMGNPEMEWNNIPISEEIDTLFLPLALRLDNTFLPLAVDIRSRKPCLFFLFLLDG